MKPGPYKILFPVETAVRELQSKLLLALSFAQRGFECYVGSKDEITKLLDYVAPVVYFDKGYHAAVSEPLFKRIRKRNGLIVSLDEENGVDFRDFHNVSKRFPPEAFDHYDLVFLWGTPQYDFLCKTRSNIKKERVVISGHPKYDLLKPRYNSLYQPTVDRLHRQYGRFILVNMCIKYYNNIREREEVLDNYRGRAKKVDERLSYEREKLEATIPMIHDLAGQTDMSIIIRPHPEEDIEYYRKEFRQRKNVHVVYDLSVIYWIMAAEIVIHNDSSTGVETAMVGKIPLSFLPHFDVELSPWLPVEMSRRFTEKEELLSFVQARERGDIDANEEMNPSGGRLLDEYFSFDKDSTDIIVESTQELIAGRAPTDVHSHLRWFALVENSQSVLAEVRRRLLPKWRRSRSLRLLRNKLKGLDRESVTSEFQALNRLVGEDVNIRAVNGRLYRVSR